MAHRPSRVGKSPVGPRHPEPVQSLPVDANPDLLDRKEAELLSALSRIPRREMRKKGKLPSWRTR